MWVCRQCGQGRQIQRLTQRFNAAMLQYPLPPSEDALIANFGVPLPSLLVAVWNSFLSQRTATVEAGSETKEECVVAWLAPGLRFSCPLVGYQLSHVRTC